MHALGTLGSLLVLIVALVALCGLWVLGWAVGTVCGLLLPEGEDERGE